MLGVFGVILTLILLMYFAYKGASIIILAPILALLAALLSAGLDAHLMATYTEVFMQAFANYAKSYFPIFMLGAIFGKLMDESGAAKAIAHGVAEKFGKERALLAVVISCAVLTYGGVSLFVVAFAVFPIAASLFEQSNIPKKFIPPAIALGSFTFTMTALPGTPQIQNAIPMKYFGTDAYAAPILGISAAIIMGVAGVVYLNREIKKAQEAGEGYGKANEDIAVTAEEDLPPFSTSIIPIIVVLVLNYILGRVVYPKIDGSYLEKFGTDLQSVSGTWSLIISLIAAVLLTILLNRKRFDSILKNVNTGAANSLPTIINTASVVGYGNVIGSLAAFEIVKNAILGVSSNPLISEAISVNVLAGITGSASGGMSISLEALSEQYLTMAAQAGINPQVLHRIASLTSGGLDTLPHNGAVVSLLTVCGMTHKDSYKYIFIVSVVIPMLTSIVAILFGNLGVV